MLSTEKDQSKYVWDEGDRWLQGLFESLFGYKPSEQQEHLLAKPKG